MSRLIEFEHITKKFPGVVALSDVSFSIEQGEIHAIVGENGAGKSTLMNILGGQYPATSGIIKYKGNEIQIHNQAESLGLGIGIVYQELKLCQNLSISENLFLGHEKNEKGKRIPSSSFDKQAQEILGKLGSIIPVSTKLHDISLAGQQLVEIARALCRNADVIIMDEPTSSLTIRESENLFRIIKNLKDEGKTIIYISHRMEEVFRLADRISILRDGKYLGTFKNGEISHDEVITMIAGHEVKSDQDSRNIKDINKKEIPVLEVRNFSRAGVFSDLNFKLYKGEILGLYGLQGAGRTELLECIFGLYPKKSGELYLNGKLIQNDTPLKAIKNGFGMVPENRLKDGFFPKMSIRDNSCSVCTVDKTKRGGIFLDKKKMEDYCQKSITELSVRASSSDQLISQLSGGNQQKVIMGKWLNANPKILLIDEPTRGVDVGAKAEIFEILRKLSSQGLSILLVSSELSEVVSQSNRIIVMKEGKFVAEYDAKEVSKEKVVAAAI